MAAATFDTASFTVLTRDGYGPGIVRDRDGAPRYTATIRPVADADHDALQAAVSLVTTKRALGSFAFTAIVESGPGSATLTVPSGANGAMAAYTAILVRYEPQAHQFRADEYKADAEWLILSEVS